LYPLQGVDQVKNLLQKTGQADKKQKALCRKNELHSLRTKNQAKRCETAVRPFVSVLILAMPGCR